MLMGSDFDLNSSQRYPDSMKEVLKQTLLNQEGIFRRQVHELHRLYTIQKSLMKSDGCSLDPFAHQMRYDLLAMEKACPRIPMVDSTQSAVDNIFLREGKVTCSRLQQRPLDLQPTAGNCINYFCGDLLKRRNDQNSGQNSAELKHYIGDYNVSYQEEVNLSLSIGRANRRESIGRKTWNDKKTYPSSQEIIDLEESIETASDEDTKLVFPLGCTSPITSANQHNNLMKDPSHEMPNSSVNGSELCQEWSFLNQGSNEWHGDLPCNDMNPKGAKQFTSYEAADFDLNINQIDESSYSNEPLGANPSSGSSSGIFCGLIRKSNESAKSAIDLESVPGPTSDLSEDPLNCTSRNSEHQNMDLPLSSQEDGPILPEVNKEKAKEDYSVQKAAFSLICISLQGSSTSTSDQDCITKSGSIHIENEEKEKEKPECSSDSYESLVLKLEESSIDDCVSSKPFEMDARKEGVIKLRRGSRLKDFQKDILPTLSSLSRHEIWEDINIMEGVIRSREYKRMRAKAGNNAENWFTPVKSRRSRLNCVGRRRVH